MHEPAKLAGSLSALRLPKVATLNGLGILLGFVMPLAAAAIYPTYMHQMEQPWLEWTRLMEQPFVACELVVIFLALRRGLNDRAIWQRLPADVKIAFGLLVVGLFVSTLLSSKNLATSLAFSLFTLVHIRFGLAVFHLVRVEPKQGSIAFVTLLAAGLIPLACLTALKFSFPPPEEAVFGGRIEWSSALPGFINVRHFGSWTGAIAAGLLMALLYREGGECDRRSHLWLYALYFLAVAMTVWSATRAAALAAAVVGLVFLLTLRRMPRLPAIFRVGGLTVAAIAVALSLPTPNPDFMWFVDGDMNSANAATGGRLALWAATFHKWLEAPLFGWGSGSTFWEVYVGWAHTQPHNVVLQFLISWGLVGAAGGLWLLGRAIVAVHHQGVTDETLRPLTGVLYSLLFMSLLEGMLHYPRFIMVIMIGFAVIMARKAGDLEKRTA